MLTTSPEKQRVCFMFCFIQKGCDGAALKGLLLKADGNKKYKIFQAYQEY